MTGLYHRCCWKSPHGALTALSGRLKYRHQNRKDRTMPQKSFAVSSVIFGILWAIFVYPPGPAPFTPRAAQAAQGR
jgi:hypothetical protein